MISKLRSRFAYLLRRRLGFPTQELALARLRTAGFQPKAILDVGASNGLFADEAWLYWSDAVIHCFEPEPEYVRQLERRAETDPRLKVCGALVGATNIPEQTYFHLMGGSTVLQENTDRPGGATTTCGPPRTSRMITLDGYCEEQGIRPEFLKIDVQGYELEVLKGAERVLSSVDVILTEVNHTELFKGVPLSAELIAWIAQRGFALHDICNFMRRPRDDALWQSDMIFVRHTSKLRALKRGD
jgi:FkbM family methyltransferase